MPETSWQCPVCKRPLMGPNETCGGSFTDKDHPPAVLAEPASLPPQEPKR